MDDLISRQAALEHYRVVDPGGTFVYCSSIIEFLESLPSVDVPDRNVGKWIEKSGNEFPVCSNCGCWFDVLQNTGDFYYCPNCGAKMEDSDGKSD